MEQNQSLIPTSSSSRIDRKTIEKNRRNEMKALYSTLNSLVPHQSPRAMLSLPDQLDEAASYIKKLQINLEKMKEKKQSLIIKGERSKSCIHDQSSNNGAIASMYTSNDGVTTMAASPGGLKLPRVEIYHVDSALEVVLITAMDFQYRMFNDAIRMLHEEEGVDVINASFSALDNLVFHTIHSKINGGSEAAAYKAQRISERLHNYVNGTC